MPPLLVGLLALAPAAAAVADYSGRLLPASMRMQSVPAATGVTPSPRCPCADQALCRALTVQHKREFFGFGGSRWSGFDWGLVTTVAWAKDPDIVCRAHQSGARIIAAPPTLLFSGNPAERQAWIQQLIVAMRRGFYDGVTFDYESPLDMTPGSPTAERQQQYVALVNETAHALRVAIPGSQTSVCAAWSPDDIDGRNYDYKALAEASDLLYVMGYDTRSQVYGRCIAGANAALPLLERGIRRYLELGVPPEKLVMGTPWYGYRYPCLNRGPKDEFCQIKLTPFRGVNCSDAAGSEVSFMHIMNLYDRGVCPPGVGKVCQVTTPIRWDQSTQSPYFNFVTDGTRLWQMWFDDARSSALKYEAARNLGVRGVGPFTWDDLDNEGTVTGNPSAPAQSKSMWEALRVFYPLGETSVPVVFEV